MGRRFNSSRVDGHGLLGGDVGPARTVSVKNGPFSKKETTHVHRSRRRVVWMKGNRPNTTGHWSGPVLQIVVLPLLLGLRASKRDGMMLTRLV